MKRTRAIFALSLAAGLAACASKATTAAEGSSATANRTARRDPSVMDSTELRSGDYATVYDAISRKHADWLLPRGGPSGGRTPELGVWIEGQTRSRGVDYLKNIRPIDIIKVRRLSITESTGSYNWPWGGLVITARY